ncbi:MAG: ATP-dependent Clp protease ATP-binding subunit [Faecousia sp.]
MGRENEQTRQILRQAWGLACFLGHSCVGTEHLLIAIALTPASAAYRALSWQAVSAWELLGQLVQAVGRGRPTERLVQGLSPKARRAIAVAAAEGSPITPEALLTAMLRDESSGAGRLLSRCAVSADVLFTDLYLGQSARKEQAMPNTRLLDQFGVDLVERADKSERIIGRQREIETVLQILSRKQKNNPALIGEPGVGKTAIVEGVAQYIAAGRVPEQLRGKRLFALDMASVIAGTKYRGEFEERVRDIIAEVRRVQNVILFIDEMHTLVGAGAAEGAIDAANLLKPALGRGELQLIGATTLSEYRKFIEKDAALERRFRPVQVREPSREETREILEGLREGLEAHHRITISAEALDAAVELSCRYLTDKFLPDKAVDLLDEGAACASMARTLGCPTDTAQEMEQSLRDAVRAGQYEEAAKLRDRLQRLRKSPAVPRMVRAQDIAAAVANRTGIPVGTVSLTEKQRLRTLEATLGKRVIGQDAAVRAVAEAVRRGRSGIAEQKRPVAAMLFTGPTGVGKTELCKALAEAVYGSESAMIRVDMSEYMEKFSVSRLIGAPPGYVGHDEGGELSERVRRRPYSLVLLDELEKAHPDVCGLLLQIMEDGILTDSNGRCVDFKNTLLVMTSNLGSCYAGRAALGFGAQAEDMTARALQEHFPPEFLGRIDCIATFRPLGEAELTKIAAKQLDALRQRAAARKLQLTYASELPVSLAKRCHGKRSGARELRRLIQSELEAPLAQNLLSEQPKKEVTVLLRDNAIVLQ